MNKHNTGLTGVQHDYLRLIAEHVPSDDIGVLLLGLKRLVLGRMRKAGVIEPRTIKRKVYWCVTEAGLAYLRRHGDLLD